MARIVIEFILNWKIPSILGDVTEMLFSFAFLSLLRIFISRKQITNTSLLVGVNCLDSISYEIYLVHHIFILGVWSVMKETKYIPINISMAVFLTFISAILLHILSNNALHLIEKKAR